MLGINSVYGFLIIYVSLKVLCEAYLSGVYKIAFTLSKHAGRSTITPKDVGLVSVSVKKPSIIL